MHQTKPKKIKICKLLIELGNHLKLKYGLSVFPLSLFTLVNSILLLQGPTCTINNSKKEI